MRKALVWIAAALVFLAAISVFSSNGKSPPIVLEWPVTLGSVKADELEVLKPCASAAVTLKLRDSNGKTVSTFAVPTDFPAYGVVTGVWRAQVRSHGSFEVTATDHGCGKRPGKTASVAIEISEKEVPEGFTLQARGERKDWHLYYFAVTKRFAADGVLTAQGDPIRVENVSQLTLTPCRLTLFPQAQVFELIEDEWVEKTTYRYPEDAETLPPGGFVDLEKSGMIIVRRPQGEKRAAEAPVQARMLKLLFVPSPGSYVYLNEGDENPEARPFPGLCDSYFLNLPLPSATKGNNSSPQR